MKKIILTFTIVIFTATTLFAQRRPRFSHKEYQDKQKAFIIEQVKLTPEESELFFPLYFELQKKKWGINHEAHKKVGVKRGEEATEEQCILLVNEFAEAKIKIAELEKEYTEKYLKIIPAKKIMGIQRAEGQFQKEILKKISNKKEKK